MNKIIPKKINIGDEIRVIAPSRSMSILSNEVIVSTLLLNAPSLFISASCIVSVGLNLNNPISFITIILLYPFYILIS